MSAVLDPEASFVRLHLFSSSFSFSYFCCYDSLLPAFDSSSVRSSSIDAMPIAQQSQSSWRECNPNATQLSRASFWASLLGPCRFSRSASASWRPSQTIRLRLQNTSWMVISAICAQGKSKACPKQTTLSSFCVLLWLKQHWSTHQLHGWIDNGDDNDMPNYVFISRAWPYWALLLIVRGTEQVYSQLHVTTAAEPNTPQCMLAVTRRLTVPNTWESAIGSI